MAESDIFPLVPYSQRSPEIDYAADRSFAKIILRSGALAFGPFTLSSGERGPIKVTIEDILENKQYVQMMVRKLAEMIAMNRIEFDKVCGVITGGAKLAWELSRFIERPVLARLGVSKDQERPDLLYGDIDEGDQILLIEDVVTTGGTVIRCAQGITEEGGKVQEMLGFFTYGMRSTINRLMTAGIKAHFLTNFDTLIDTAKDTGVIDYSSSLKIRKWRDKLDERLQAQLA